MLLYLKEHGFLSVSLLPCKQKMLNPDEERICVCALNMVLGHRPAIIRTLIANLHSATAVFRLNEKEKTGIFGPYSKISAKITPAALDAAEKELKTAEKYGCTFIYINEPAYPKLLSECEDAPAGLYVRSRIPAEELFSGNDFIAVVGTRNISEYGKSTCKSIIHALADTAQQPVIVSGLAFGTDITAHIEATGCGLRTIAVLPAGLDRIYPRYHDSFAEKMIADGKGAIVSDFPFGTSVFRTNFSRRNRIIAGLSKSTILIESKIKGGGLITANYAFSYSRDVYALPGRLGDSCSEGCNMLVAKGIAAPITSCDTLVSSLGYRFGKRRPATETSVRSYSGAHLPGSEGTAERIMDAVARKTGITLHEIAAETGIPFNETAAIAGILESDGFLTVDIMQRCSINEKNM